MTKNQLKEGSKYTCKVSNKLTTVKLIKADFDRNRYVCLNLNTNREIVLKSGARLRAVVEGK